MFAAFALGCGEYVQYKFISRCPRINIDKMILLSELF